MTKPASTGACQLTLLSRPWCSLCQTMQSAVEGFAADFSFSFHVIDVDEHAPLVALYDEDVPVLLVGAPDAAAQSPVIAKHRLDHGKLRAWLTAHAIPALRELGTARLRVRPLAASDAPFMLRLLNEPSWMRFIGDRNVHTEAEAAHYILNRATATYATHGFGFLAVDLAEGGTTLGICGLAQRDYLDSPDIGFAFLPEYWGKGYAYEASIAVLADAKSRLGITRLLATTRPENTASQQLLTRLGLRFERMIKPADQDLLVYASTASSA